MNFPKNGYNPDDYMTPEIAEVLPMLDFTCAMLTQPDMVQVLTAKIKEWVTGDPEMADVLKEGKKTLQDCVRYVTEQAAEVCKIKMSAMTADKLAMLASQQDVHGHTAAAVGLPVTEEQVYGWAKEYLTDPQKNPTNLRMSDLAPTPAPAPKKGAQKPGPKKKTTTKGKGAGTASAAGAKPKSAVKESGGGPSGTAAPGADASAQGAVVENSAEEAEQISLFGNKDAA